MAAADSAWVQWLTDATGFPAASTRAGVRTDDDAAFDLEVPSVVVQRDGGGDLTRFTDGPLVFVDVLAPNRSVGESMCADVDQAFRYGLPAVMNGVSLRMRRCVSGFSEVGDDNTGGVVHYSATYECVTR